MKWTKYRNHKLSLHFVETAKKLKQVLIIVIPASERRHNDNRRWSDREAVTEPADAAVFFMSSGGATQIYGLPGRLRPTKCVAPPELGVAECVSAGFAAASRLLHRRLSMCRLSEAKQNY